jgi:hypothetical protein
MYTPEQVEELKAAYLANPSPETVAELAAKYGKSIKSIVGKLSKEGIYQKTVYRSKTGELPVTKLELVDKLQAATGLTLEGLEKAPKSTLKKLLAWAASPDDPV